MNAIDRENGDFMYSVIDFGADGDGREICTKAFQAAVDACSGGGIVYIPFGTYLLGTVFLKSNVHFVFESGARILGSKRLKEDFAPDEERRDALYQDASHSFFDHSLFVAKGCENISFSGLGTIDMQNEWESDDWRRFPADSLDRRRGAKIFTFVECENIVLKDMRLINATDLAVYPVGCKNVRISNLDIDSHIDGISPDGCKNVTIANCIVNTGDDAIVIKSSFALGRKIVCENVSVTGCIISSRCNAIKLGTESNGGYRNITVTGCTVSDTSLSGIALEVADGGFLDGVTISDITMKNVGNPIFIVLCDRRRGPDGTGIGRLENVIISNVTATGPYESWEAVTHDFFNNEKIVTPMIQASSVTGLPGVPVKNITLSNIYLSVPGGEKKPENTCVPENPGAYPENFMYGKLPCFGIFFRHCRGLRLDNVSVEAIVKDDREAMIFCDTKKMGIKNI